jgi:hypothetical protein
MCNWCIKIGFLWILHLTIKLRTLLVNCMPPKVFTVQSLSASALTLKYNCQLNSIIHNWTLNSINSFQNEKLSHICLVLYFNRFGSISRHSGLVIFVYFLYVQSKHIGFQKIWTWASLKRHIFSICTSDPSSLASCGC